MFRLKTFGGLSLADDAGPRTGHATRRSSLALLVLLAVARERGVTRDKLLGYLWPERDEEKARHALAQALYELRRELGKDAILLRASDLRLNPERVTSDVAEFEDALERGDGPRALALYRGPFLDGFFLNGARDFEHWVEAERGRLARRAVEACEALATAAASRGDHRAAVSWWNRLLELDPLNSRAALALMRALVAAGDRAGALAAARTHESVLRAELDIGPEDAVRALADELRTGAPPPAPRVSSPDKSQVLWPTWAGRERSWRRRVVTVVVPAGLVAAVAVAAWPRAAPPILAVGTIADYGSPDSAGDARALGDMLATNLARLPGVQVVATARLYDLLGQMPAAERAAVPLTVIARRAGATELVEGVLYRPPGGSLRLDVRRVDLRSGAVRAAAVARGPDLFVLADSATAELARGLDRHPAGLRIADVTTRSLVAYRLYEQGLREHYQQGDARRALRLFEAALREDSTFAMAALYAWQSAIALSDSTADVYRAQAVRMADRATDRERLMILAYHKWEFDEPSALALAETLATRYPTEPDGHLSLGRALAKAGRFTDAVPPLRRVIAMDSSLSGLTPRCSACEAYWSLMDAFQGADSMAAAERVAREFLSRSPRSSQAWAQLVIVLTNSGRYAEALDARQTLEQLSPSTPDAAAQWHADLALRRGDFPEADRALAQLLKDRNPLTGAYGLLPRIIALRYQGRLREAEVAAREGWRLGAQRDTTVSGRRYSALPLAQVLFEAGRPRDAAALFDSMVAHPVRPSWQRALFARFIAWNLTHVATALAAAGDTSRLARLADSIEILGRRSNYGRDQLLHHHVRGLLLVARGRLPEAEAEFRRAVYSPTHGYTRTNLELGRLLLAKHRPREAAAILSPALRGPLDASSFYVTRTELHELLAQAYDEAGQPDSAAAHYRWVVNAWRRADPLFEVRQDAARRRLAALENRQGGHGKPATALYRP